MSRFTEKELYRTLKPYMMKGPDKFRALLRQVRDLEWNGIAGRIVECGVYKGGSLAAMGYESHRDLVACDSFVGLPQPTEQDLTDLKLKEREEYPIGDMLQPEGTPLTPINRCVGPLDTVKGCLFDIAGIDPERVEFVEGWYQDTLPLLSQTVGNIALLHIDCDWYDSTKIVLENLYDAVVPNGVVVLDDHYYWNGSATAAIEFFSSRGIHPKLSRVKTSAHFRKK